MLSGLLATGSRPGTPAEVRLYDAGTGSELRRFLVDAPRFRRGVEVAIGDVNNDAAPEIVTAPGAGSARPIVQIYSATGALLSRFAVGPASYRGGVSIAVGDVNGDGRDDIIVSEKRGPSWVSLYNGLDGTLLGFFLAYGTRYRGGVQVAVGDFRHDGHADIATVNESGAPVVKVFDGVTGSVMTDLRLGKRATPGGVSIAAGDINGDHTPDIILASAARSGRSTGAEVRIFRGASGTSLADFRVSGKGYASGVRVAAIDLNGDHTDELALSPAGRGFGVVLDTSLLRSEALFPFNYSAAGTLPSLRDVGSATPPVAYRFAGSGVSLSASSSVTESTPASLAAEAAPASNVIPLTPIQRLAYYDPNSGKFVPVTPNDPRLAGKDVSVLVHGWAPGYDTWVQAAAKQGQVLTWWATFRGQPGYSKKLSEGMGPDAAWLLDGTIENQIKIAQTGLAQMLGATDPRAAVLAYSWIDDSATPVSSWTGIPEDAYLSEARTALNGERLAVGLEEVLGSNFDGKLQLIGHSHGSKVATVASVALSQAPTPIKLNQLTILDSPESPDTTLGLTLAEEGAANYNWYFLQALNVNRQSASGTFVDNDISYFDQPYDNISYPGSNPNLGQVVDVTLYPEPYSSTDISGQHDYAANWYTGSGEPALTSDNSVGRLWSPLLPGNTGPNAPPANLLPSYQQSWTFYNYSQSNQFDLESNPLSASNPSFSSVTLPAQSTPGITVTNPSAGATVDLTQTGGTLQSFTGCFTTPGLLHGIRGITFQYQFPTSAQGDTLTISIDGSLGFVMDASLLQSPNGLGTISLGDVFGDQTHTLTFTLTSAAAHSTSEVKVTNLQQFYWA